MSSTEQRLQLDVTSIKAEAITDEDGRPALVIRSGNVVVELSGGAHLREAVAGARRIVDAIWDYTLAVETQRLSQPEAPPQVPWLGEDPGPMPHLDTP